METDSSNGMWRIAVLGVCLIVSAFFSASEASLLTVGKIRVRNLVDEGVKNAKTLISLLEDPDRVLSAILIGNNLVNILASAITTSLVIQYVGGNTGVALGIATGIVTLAILIFGEITPKSFAMRRAESIAVFIAKPMYAIVFILKPLIYVLNKITSVFVLILSGKSSDTQPTFTENELKTMVTVSHEEGVLNVDEKEMIHNVFEFGDGDVREIMTPRIHVVSIDLDAEYGDVKAVFEEHAYSRIPITKPGTDEIVGILNIKDIAFLNNNEDEFEISDYLRPAHFVYEFNNIAKVFGEMRRERIRMSVVLDEYGVMAGIITTEDFIEEIVGDINDEYDDAEMPAKEVGDNEYIVDGTMGIDNFCEIAGIEIESDDFDSIGGFVLGKLEDFPTAGDVIEHENIEFTVESVANNRIESLRVKLRGKSDAGHATKISAQDNNGVNVPNGSNSSNGDARGDTNENDIDSADVNARRADGASARDDDNAMRNNNTDNPSADTPVIENH